MHKEGSMWLCTKRGGKVSCVLLIILIFSPPHHPLKTTPEHVLMQLQLISATDSPQDLSARLRVVVPLLLSSGSTPQALQLAEGPLACRPVPLLPGCFVLYLSRLAWAMGLPCDDLAHASWHCWDPPAPCQGRARLRVAMQLSAELYLDKACSPAPYYSPAPRLALQHA